MKIVFYSPRFYPLLGGLERVVAQWGNELVRLGEDITLITTTTHEGPDDFDFTVVRRPGFWKAVKLMRQADLVVQFNVALKGLPAWMLSGRPLVFSHHTLLYEPGSGAPWNQRLKLLVSNAFARQNICCSQYIAAQFNKAVVVHSPYNAGVFQSLRVEREALSLVYAGRLVADKGVDILLKALPLLPPEAWTRLTIVGDGEKRPGLQALSTQLGLQQKVVFTGSQPSEQLVQILHAHEIMVVPSRVEPFGITVLEGLASGCKMVVSNTGGLPEAAGGMARLFEKESPEALAKSLEASLSNDTVPDPGKVKGHLNQLSIEVTARQFLEQLQAVM